MDSYSLWMIINEGSLATEVRKLLPTARVTTRGVGLKFLELGIDGISSEVVQKLLQLLALNEQAVPMLTINKNWSPIVDDRADEQGATDEGS